MKLIYKWILLIGAVSYFLGCKKESLLPYELGSGISIYKKNISEGYDSLTYSFAVKPNDLLSDTISLPLRILGEPANVARKVAYGIVDSLTTATKENYRLLDAVIPDGSYTGTLQLIIFRTPNLQDKELSVGIRLEKNNEFYVGPKELSEYLIKINDFLTKPNYWPDVWLGEYSQVKYGLIIRETGYVFFDDLKPEVLIYIRDKCRNFLNVYYEEHGEEMLDENSLPVKFP